MCIVNEMNVVKGDKGLLRTEVGELRKEVGEIRVQRINPDKKVMKPKERKTIHGLL